MRVLVATDGSPSATLAVDLVATMPWPAETTVHVLEAVPSAAELFSGPWPALAVLQADDLEAAVRGQAEETVRDAVGRVSRAGVTVLPVVVTGRPATAIVDEARQVGADMIVVGSRGAGPIESMLLGSVSSEVVDRSPIPVLVARGDERRGGIGRVLLAWDGSVQAAKAASLLTTWPIFARSCIRVVTVTDVQVPWWAGMPEPGSPELLPVYLDAVSASRKEHRELADTMTADLVSRGLAAEADCREGDAAHEILAAAKAWRADVIVMGTHGRSALARVVLGSVARNVLHHAPCSVLVVRDSLIEPAHVSG